VTTPRDTRRVEAIERYDVLHHPPRSDLRALVELAAIVADVPMATINLITADEQVQVATVGFEPAVCRREDSMCAITITLSDAVVVSDASQDDRFRDNPFVTGRIGHVRFYASHQLVTPEGVTIGTLCVFDNEPRRIEPRQVGALQTLADRVVDVLELQLAHQRLLSATDRLATANERLGAFAGQVSHDLKNPLAAISMSLEMALEEAEGADGMLVPLLQRAARGADRMGAMIQDLLSFAHGGADPEPAEVDLVEVMEAVLEDLGEAVGEASIVVGDLPTLVGDPVQLRALLQNLVSNAVKFSGGKPEARVDVVADRIDDVWRIEVADNGPGVPETERQRVFEPFARIDKTVPGTGVGLATCKRIVEAHGGRIGLAAAPGGGTVAWFELPATAS
jgi:signal transduction histidine kinase